MAEVILKNGRKIGDFGTPYFIAEVNSSHNGSIERAFEMIDAAKEAGSDCVKFQSWTPDTLYSKSYYSANPIAKRMVTKFSMSEEELTQAARHCEEVGVSFSSTPYSEREVDFLADLNVPFIKIASMEINNLPFIEYIAKKQLPVIMSTGMSDMDEIEKAVRVFEQVGNEQLVLLHCVSIYPCTADITNLRNITGLKERFPKYHVGYSDHSLGYEIPCAAVALGAGVIEKHFTLDSSRMGWDNNMAMEPQQFRRLVDACNNVSVALGSVRREVPEAELKQRLNMRRSVIAAVDIAKGTVITESMLSAKRPGTGLAPEMIYTLAGRTAARDIEADTLVELADFE